MTKDIVKQGFALAEKEQKEKQVEEVKQIVLKTLEKKRKFEKERDEIIGKIKVLNMDIEDLKNGKLDRIAERQEKDEEAKKVSVVIIIKEKVINNYNPWYIPYQIIWNTPSNNFYYANSVTCDNALLKSTYTDCNTDAFVGYNHTINCSVAKEATAGAYELSNNEIVHLR